MDMDFQAAVIHELSGNSSHSIRLKQLDDANEERIAKQREKLAALPSADRCRGERDAASLIGEAKARLRVKLGVAHNDNETQSFMATRTQSPRRLHPHLRPQPRLQPPRRQLLRNTRTDPITLKLHLFNSEQSSTSTPSSPLPPGRDEPPWMFTVPSAMGSRKGGVLLHAIMRRENMERGQQCPVSSRISSASDRGFICVSCITT